MTFEIDPWTRRRFFQLAGLAGAGVTLGACASEPESPAEQGGGKAPSPVFNEPATQLSGELSILLWSHFVPSHDTWFDSFAKEWGKKVGVNVRVDHVDVGNVPTQIASEIQAGQGHDILQYIATLSEFEEGVLDLTDVNDEVANRHGEQLAMCRESSYNPHTDKFYALAPGWVPDPGNFRKSLWEPVGFPDGPSTWDELLQGSSEIKKSQNVPVGLGMSQEIDSNMAGHALLWSHGASVQDANENVVLDSPETIAAVEFMQKLFKNSMTDEVFSWNASSNNEGLIAGELSYILNSISAWRSSQEANPEVANDTFFVPALEGPETALAAQHVMYNYVVPKHAKNPDAAKEFLLHFTDNFGLATYHSRLYDFPSWSSLSPQLGDWLSSDPFGAKPADKLSFLGDVDTAAEWSASIGHPGPSSPAIGEVIGTFVIPNMFARAARGGMSPEQTVKRAHEECQRIFSRWRKRDLIGGG
ncbi:ABC transporter substrate-binding protein [Haloechinothrix halophila]|uniref:ABC transporter substrate-binding protein n=1 Tax=Haloechinothrix halophila TaxID=1069073 RepID=UPI00042078E0|nr:extracellular solute-binding protein [Haloechinothrix halophila]